MPYKPFANLLIAAFLLLLSMVAVTQGSVPIAAGQLWQSLKLLATAASETEYAMAHRIIIELRLPRVLLGLMVGAGLALYFKTKNAKLKKYVAESIPVGILGVGEPLMYAVTLPLVRPFVTACLGAGFGGALAALLHIGTVSQGVSGLFGLLIVVPGQQLGYVAAMLLAYAAGFVLTWFFGVDEQKINEFFGE